jgi:peptide/nickel transport system substrate-binding protein
MNNSSTDLAPTVTSDHDRVINNTEWQLADIVDAITAEIDHAEDTLALKSYARGMSFSIRQLSLDLQVAVRRDDNGQVKFRTAEPNSTGTTILKLDFAQLLKSQLGDDRRKLEQNIDRRPLDAIGLTSAEIAVLNAIAIYAVDDLHRYSQTAAMLSEVSRKTGIQDARLRQVLGLPYLEALKPDRGLPGSTILLEGGNFGAMPPSQASIYFQGVALEIVAWSNARIQVKIPQTAKGNGVLFVAVNDQISNPIDWQALTIDLIVQDITITPSNPQENDEITLTASLTNQGAGATEPFAVEWSIDGEIQKTQPHGVLLPGQSSQESSLVFKTKLPAGDHKFSFTADPEGFLPDIDRANSIFTKDLTVIAATNVGIGYYHVLDSLDPFVSEQPWELRQSVLNLVYRGLMRFDPNSGALLNDLSQAPRRSPKSSPVIAQELKLARPIIPVRVKSSRVTYQLRQDVRFHDGTALTAEDVVFSYQRAKESPLWTEMLEVITSIEIIDPATVVFISEGVAPNFNPQIWTLPIVPARAYKTDPQRFSTNPIGCGPFMAALEQNGKTGLVRLQAFDQYHGGTPRLKTLSIMLQPNSKILLDLLLSGRLSAIILPDQPGLLAKFTVRRDRYQVIQTTTGMTKMLHVTYVPSRPLLERLPNNYETEWNAHLWYV